MRLYSKNNVTVVGIALVVISLIIVGCKNFKIHAYSIAERMPIISPDYSQIMIPPNIAPLNFSIKEKAEHYCVKIYSFRGDTIQIRSKNPKIIIPINKWRKLLKQNIDHDLLIDIYTQSQEGIWIKFETINNHIVPDKLDSYVAYRLINPGYVLYDKMGIYCRNVENYREKAIIVNDVVDRNCMNCHSFCQNDAKKMMFHIRGSHGGTVIYNDGKLKKINTSTKYTMSPGVYPAWHPNGKLIAFSVNMIKQKFNTDNKEPIEVFDGYSDIIVYDIKSNTISTSPKISTQNKESLPAWSPDGKYLYYVIAPPISDTKRHSQVMYDLVRISYNYENNYWGEIDTILSSKNTNMSISWPKVSPDGKYILFCMANHGYFTIHYRSSDLYLLNLETGKYLPLNVNSESSDSYHSWSSNSRWFVFSSKREDGLCSRLFYCYIDKNGKTYKPFILPQKDPDFYASFMKNYNIPEMVIQDPVINRNKLNKIVHEDALTVQFDQTVDKDALSGASRIEH